MSMRTGSPIHELFSVSQVAQLIDQTCAFLLQLKVPIRNGTSLDILFRRTQKFCREWQDRTLDPAAFSHLIDVGHVQDICMAMLAGANDPAMFETIRRVTNNAIALQDRDLSQGKDALWELQLLHLLQRHNAPVRGGEPDLLLDLSFRTYGLPCKKVYRESALNSQFKSGAKQLKSAGVAGIIAVNLDDLVPAKSFMAATSLEEADKQLASWVIDFIDKNTRFIQSYVASRAIDGAIFSMSAPTDVRTPNGAQLNMVRQRTMWTLESSTKAQKDRLGECAAIFGIPTL